MSSSSSAAVIPVICDPAASAAPRAFRQLPGAIPKWNKVEHRLFCHLSKNWRGRPLFGYTTVIEIIGATVTKTGLAVKAVLDHGEYPGGAKVTDAEIRELNLEKKRLAWRVELLPASRQELIRLFRSNP